MVSATFSAWGRGQEREERRLSDVSAPLNSNERRVDVIFLGVVPMSWRRVLRKYVSSNVGVDQVGNAWVSIACPIF